MPFLAYIFVKGKVRNKGFGCCEFSSAIRERERERGKGEFMYKTSILGNKSSSNMIDREATLMQYITRVVFLIDSYIFCLTEWLFVRDPTDTSIGYSSGTQGFLRWYHVHGTTKG